MKSAHLFGRLMHLKDKKSCVYKELHWKEMVVTELTVEIVFIINDLKTKLMVL